MDLGDWIGAILLIGSLLVGAFSKKKDEDKEETNPRSQQKRQRSANRRTGLASAMPSLYALMTEEESDEYTHAPTVESFHYTSSSTPPPPPAPAMQPEGQRVTTDISEPVADAPLPEPSSSRLNLHDKDALRRAIILSDILPPRF